MRRTLIATLLALTVIAGGCTKAAQPTEPALKPAVKTTAPATASEPTQAPAPPSKPTEAPGKSIGTMTPAQAREKIAQSFPVETPVPAGDIVAGEAQGESAWDYEIVVDASPTALAEWYRTVYQNRSWKLVSEQKTTELSGAQGVEMSFRKLGAGTRVTITAQDDKAHATVVVGVGTEVLETQ